MFTHMKNENSEPNDRGCNGFAAASGVVPLAAARAESAEIETSRLVRRLKDCTITLPEELAGKEYRITDGLVESYQTFESGQTITVDAPGWRTGHLEWYQPTSAYSVTQTDERRFAFRGRGTTVSQRILSAQRGCFTSCDHAFRGGFAFHARGLRRGGTARYHPALEPPTAADLLVVGLPTPRPRWMSSSV